MRKSAATDHLKDNGITSSKDLHPECFGKARVRNIKIIDMAISGASLAEIAKDVGLGAQSIENIIFARVRITKQLKRRAEREESARLFNERLIKDQAEVDALHEQKPILKKIRPELESAMIRGGFRYSPDQSSDDILQACKNFHAYMLAVFDCPIFGIKYGNQPRWACPEGIGSGLMAELAGITGIEFAAPPPTPRHHPTHQNAC